MLGTAWLKDLRYVQRPQSLVCAPRWLPASTTFPRSLLRALVRNRRSNSCTTKELESVDGRSDITLRGMNNELDGIFWRSEGGPRDRQRQDPVQSFRQGRRRYRVEAERKADSLQPHIRRAWPSEGKDPLDDSYSCKAHDRLPQDLSPTPACFLAPLSPSFTRSTCLSRVTDDDDQRCTAFDRPELLKERLEVGACVRM
jgi:hypothetical protein